MKIGQLPPFDSCRLRSVSFGRLWHGETCIGNQHSVLGCDVCGRYDFGIEEFLEVAPVRQNEVDLRVPLTAVVGDQVGVAFGEVRVDEYEPPLLGKVEQPFSVFISVPETVPSVAFHVSLLSDVPIEVSQQYLSSGLCIEFVRQEGVEFDLFRFTAAGLRGVG